MGMLGSAGRIASTLVAMIGTRLELAAVEFQADARRMLGHLAWTLLAVLMAMFALTLVALFVIVLFWDSFRLEAIGGMAVLFGGVAAIILLKVRAGFNTETPLLGATLAELRSDVEYVRHAMHEPVNHDPVATGAHDA